MISLPVEEEETDVVVAGDDVEVDVEAIGFLVIRVGPDAGTGTTCRN